MNERQERIFAILNKRGSATIEQLTAEAFASPATIRRDLKAMEKEGLLSRTWGGAIALDHVNSDLPMFVRANTNVSAKRAIGKAAAALVQGNMSIFMPSGSTVAEVAKQLRCHQNITVFTNGLDIITALSKHLSAKVFVLGGQLYESYDMVGPLTDAAIDTLNADIFFFSCSGITAEGFTSRDVTRLDVFRKMQRNSAKTVLLADTSKVGVRDTYKGFGFENIDYVVMEKAPEDSDLVKALGKKLIIAKL